MNMTRELLYMLGKYPGGFRALYKIIYGPKYSSASKEKRQKLENTLSALLSRLKKEGLVKNSKRVWSLSPEGKEFLRTRSSPVQLFSPRLKPLVNVKREIIVIFDIPEKKRKYRDWLRHELVGFGFEQIQKSVWFGPPLPKKFVKYLNYTRILKYLRFFKAREGDII